MTRSRRVAAWADDPAVILLSIVRNRRASPATRTIASEHVVVTTFIIRRFRWGCAIGFRMASRVTGLPYLPYNRQARIPGDGQSSSNVRIPLSFVALQASIA
jgi:hypothetical protein